MTAVLSSACVCGRAVVVPCPTLAAADLAAAHAAIEAAGHRWLDGIGHRCADFPACATREPLRVPSPPPQGGLFAGRADA